MKLTSVIVLACCVCLVADYATGAAKKGARNGRRRRLRGGGGPGLAADGIGGGLFGNILSGLTLNQQGAINPNAIANEFTESVLQNTPGASLSSVSKANSKLLSQGFLMGMATGSRLLDKQPFIVAAGGYVISTYCLCDQLGRTFDAGDGTFYGILLKKIDPTHDDLVEFFNESGFTQGGASRALAQNTLLLLQKIVSSFSKQMAQEMISGCGIARNGHPYVLLVDGGVITSWAAIANYGEKSLLVMDAITKMPIGLIKTISQNALKKTLFADAVRRIPDLSNKIGNVRAGIGRMGFFDLQQAQIGLSLAQQFGALGKGGGHIGMPAFGPQAFSQFPNFNQLGPYSNMFNKYGPQMYGAQQNYQHYPQKYQNYQSYPSYNQQQQYPQHYQSYNQQGGYVQNTG